MYLQENPQGKSSQDFNHVFLFSLSPTSSYSHLCDLLTAVLLLCNSSAPSNYKQLACPRLFSNCNLLSWNKPPHCLVVSPHNSFWSGTLWEGSGVSLHEGLSVPAHPGASSPGLLQEPFAFWRYAHLNGLWWEMRAKT